ncbi:MAG: FAD-binding protein, partial [archaeon]|nr:FAD-binding protein [archaeon]
QLGGHSRPRTHRPVPPADRPVNVGFEIVRALSARVSSHPRISVRLNSRASRISLGRSGRSVAGVYLEDSPEPIRAGAVILSTGGYAADRAGLLAQHAPQLAHLATTNGRWATGDGVRLGAALGARLVHMDQVQIHPTGFVDPADPANPTKFLAPEALRGSGGLLFDPSSGRRFVNELGLRDHVAGSIMRLADHTALLVLNDAALALYSAPALKFYRAKGFVRDFPDARAFAEAYQLPYEALCEGLQAYGRQHAADPFSKTVFPVTFSCAETLYVMRVTPVLHYTMGGLAIDPQAVVQFPSTQPQIQGLFAAGEVTGGLHGANRLGGNSLLECVVFGRVAAASAFQFITTEH